MAVKPTEYPEFAEVLDPVDATSGEPSRLSPTTALKNAGLALLGWFPRNVYNYLQHLNSEWVKWFDQELKVEFEVTDDNGVGAAPLDDGMIFAIAIETGTSNHAVGFGERVGGAAAVMQTLHNQALTFSGMAGDDIPIAGGTATVTLLTLNWETQ